MRIVRRKNYEKEMLLVKCKIDSMREKSNRSKDQGWIKEHPIGQIPTQRRKSSSIKYRAYKMLHLRITWERSINSSK
jgi:hypothetical protein